ncbi:hypothetical protein ACKU3I_022390 [Serratia marcescens]
MAHRWSSKSERTKGHESKEKGKLFLHRGLDGNPNFIKISLIWNQYIPSERLDDKKKKVISMLKRKRANDNEM